MKAVILGGGLTGVSAALEFVKNGCEVTLLEASSKLGGRISSVKPSENFPETDLGQHVFSSAYVNLFGLLDDFGFSNAAKNFGELKIFFAERNGNHAQFNLGSVSDSGKISAILRLKHLTFAEKISLLNFLFFVKKSKAEEFKDKSALYLLEKKKQKKLKEKFWEKILVSIFNTPADKIYAPLLLQTLKKLFFAENGESKISVPEKAFGQIFFEPAQNYLEKHGAEILLKEKAEEFLESNGKIKKIKTNKTVVGDFDYVISTLPPHSLKNLVNPNTTLSSTLSKFGYGNILTAYIKLRENTLPKGGFILTGSKLDWLFNFGDYLTVVASATSENISASEMELKEEIILELNKFFSVFSFRNILDFVLIIKKNSTIMSDNLNCGLREQINSPYSNLLIAGDWTIADYPATSESAVISAKRTVSLVCSLGSDLGTD